jgi:hypothetical protein
LFGGELFLQFKKCLGLEVTEGKILQLAANQAHAQAVGDGRVNVDRFAGDALLTFGVEIFQRTHIVQAVGELDHHHAHVVHHCQQHFADIFRLAGLGSEQIQAADLGCAFHQARYVGAKVLGDCFQWNFCVFDDIVQQRGAERSHIQLHVR